MLKTRRERLISLLTRSLLGHYSFPNTRRDRKLLIRSFAVFCRQRAACTDDVPDCHLVKASSRQPWLLLREEGTEESRPFFSTRGQTNLHVLVLASESLHARRI